jgi:hypothetical protein
MKTTGRIVVVICSATWRLAGRSFRFVLRVKSNNSKLRRRPDPHQMSYFLPHLPSGWHVDEAIKSEEDRVVVIRFGHDWDSQCMTMDETLYSVAEKVQNFAVIYLVDITEVPDFNKVGGPSYSSCICH